MLKSRSFSFENKSKAVNVQGIPRRISYNREKPIIIEREEKSKNDKLLPDYLHDCVSHMIKAQKTQNNTSCEVRKPEHKKMLYRRSEAIDWLVGIHY